MDKEALIQTWKDIIIGDGKSWVIFNNATVVIFVNETEDLKDKALEIMKKWARFARVVLPVTFQLYILLM